MAVLIAVSTEHAVCEQALSDYRREKAARLKRQKDRLRCLCVGEALDRALQTVGLREKTAALVFNHHGKPFLKDHPEWHFSLSHSGNFAVCALSDVPIGVDVEQVRSLAFLRLAERYFTKQEVALLNDCDEEERKTLFFRLWTEKESLLKAVGIGLSGLSQTENLMKQGYRFRSYPLVGHQLTVCSPGELPTEVTVIK